jgi:hypothetical protein
VANKRLPELGIDDLQQIITCFSRYRLSKYLTATNNNELKALKLYVINTKISAAFFSDIHYIEITLRNKFDKELTNAFGPEWFKKEQCLTLLNPLCQNLLLKAQNIAARKRTETSDKELLRGQVIAELTFGFWYYLTASMFEHSLWVPYLHKSFLPKKSPKRAVFNHQINKIRKLRNRIAHHEPIFHMNLLELQQQILEVSKLLCPKVTIVMNKTSTTKREIMYLNKYIRYRNNQKLFNYELI